MVVQRCSGMTGGQGFPCLGWDGVLWGRRSSVQLSKHSWGNCCVPGTGPDSADAEFPPLRNLQSRGGPEKESQGQGAVGHRIGT